MQNLQYKHPKTGEWINLDKAKEGGFIEQKGKRLKFKNPKTKKYVFKESAKKNGFLRVGDAAKKTLFEQPSSEETSSSAKENQYSPDTRKFLLTTKSNLLTFFTHALIFPAFLDNVFSQDEKNVPLFLSNNLPKVQVNEVVFELILTIEELKALKENSYFEGALPISRVVRIHASPSTISAVREELRTFPDTHIPDFLFEPIVNLTENNYDTEIHLIKEPSVIYAVESLKNSKTFYNRILGMLAYMKCCSLYFADQEKFSSPYSKSFFSVLSPINKQFIAHNTAKENFWKKFFLSPNQSELIDLIINDIKEGKEINRDWVKILLIDAPVDIQRIFHQVVFRDYKKEALSKLDKNKWWEYYILAAIYNYRKENSIPQVPLNIVTDINPEFAEIVLAILGFYHGYAKLPKRITINLNDAFFNQLAANHNNIKFKLETSLDKKIIETVYQFCFNGKTNLSNYNYLENSLDNPVKISNLELQDGYQIKKTMQFGEKIVSYSNQNKLQLSSFKKVVIELFDKAILSANLNQLQKIKAILEEITSKK